MFKTRDEIYADYNGLDIDIETAVKEYVDDYINTASYVECAELIVDIGAVSCEVKLVAPCSLDALKQLAHCALTHRIHS